MTLCQMNIICAALNFCTVNLGGIYGQYNPLCKWFEPRSISSLYNVILRVRVALKRTVCHLMTKFTQVFQPIPSWLNWPISFNRPEL